MMNTRSIAEVAELMAVSERWLIQQLRANRFPGRKIGRHWRMTDNDILAALDTCANDAQRPTLDTDVTPVGTGLTARSRKRVMGL
jgi:excisionase family DNA binding protein